MVGIFRVLGVGIGRVLVEMGSTLEDGQTRKEREEDGKQGSDD